MKEWVLSGVIYVAHSGSTEIRFYVFLFTRNLPELRYWRVEEGPASPLSVRTPLICNACRVGDGFLDCGGARRDGRLDSHPSQIPLPPRFPYVPKCYVPAASVLPCPTQCFLEL